MLVYFFIGYSRILDVLAPFLHIPLLLGVAIYALTAITGGLQRAINTIPGRLLLVLTGLMIVSAAFGVWRGGSVKLLTDYWLKSFPFFFVIVGFTNTADRCLGLVRAVAWGVSVLCIIGLLQGETRLGRLIVANSRFGDPNDLALVCIMALPLWALLITNSQSNFAKVAGLVAVSPIALALVKTGSRGGFVGLAITALFVFWNVSLMQKIKVAAIVAVLVAVAAIVVPPEVRFRYTSLFSEEAGQGETTEEQAARGSTEGRITLLKHALILTARHPLLGVGPGNYMVAENDLAVEAGRTRGAWHETHNMYTQWSSEVGIPALLCFLWVIGHSLRRVNAVKKLQNHPDGTRLASSAFWIQTALISFCACGFFLSVAYVDTLPLLSGMAIALSQAATSLPAAVSQRTPPLRPRVPARQTAH